MRSRVAVLLALGFAAAPILAFGEEPEDAFARLYGEAHEKAKASRDTADNVLVAAQLVKDAKAKDMRQGLAVFLCDRAYELAAKVPSGQAVAAEAMQLLAEKAPDRKADCLVKLVEIRQKQYDAMKGPASDARSAASEVLIEALLAAAEAKADGGDATAAALGRKAVTLATALKSPNKSEVVARTGDLSRRLRLEKQVADLRANLSAAPPDPAARQNLVHLLVVDLDDPVRAAAFVDESCDVATRKYVPGAAKGVEAAPDTACRELADWYRSLAEGAVPASKAPPLVRAWQYYERYLRVHKGEDLARAEAAQAMKRVEEALEKLSPAKPEGTVGPARWLDILPLLDLSAGINTHGWKIEDGYVRSEYHGGCTRVPIRCTPQGSYCLRVNIVRPENRGDVAIILPVGASAVSFRINIARSGLLNVRGREISGPSPPLKVDREHALQITVLLDGDQAEVTADLDGNRLQDWRGAQTDLANAKDWALPDKTRLALGTAHGPAIFKSARLVMISGKARILR